MKEPPKASVLILASFALAIVVDAFLRGASWGINVGLLACVLVGSISLLGRFTSLKLTGTGKRFAVLMVVFALLFGLRDSNALKIANGIALALCLGAAILPASERSLREAGIGRLLLDTVGQVASLPAAFLALGHTAQAEKVWSSEASGRGKAVMRGLLLTGPLLLVFGALFASADAVFRAKLQGLFRFDFDFDVLNAHLWTLFFSLLLLGGLLHRLVVGTGLAKPPIVRPLLDAKMGITEIAMVLGSLAVLLGAFLAVQFRYLFGAGETVKATAGLSYAEYARSGFFELVGVAALALVVLLGAGASLRRERPSDDRIYRWLGRVLVAMVFCVVASAMMRMKLYTNAFGLTELRVYSTVFMAWLTFAFAWMLATTLRERPQRFAFGTFVGGLVAIFGANLLNPDALIVRTNLSKPHADFGYLKTLSDDAALAMSRMEGAIPAARRADAQEFLHRRRRALVQGDWRELNLSRWSLLP